MEQGNRQKGIWFAFLGMLGVSTDSFFIRLADIDGFDVTFWTGTFTAVVLGLLLKFRERERPLQLVRTGGWTLWLAALLQAGSTSAFVLAVTKTSVSNVVVIIAAAPLFAAVLGWLFLREFNTRRVWAAVVVVMAGVLIVVSGSIGGGSLDGDLFAVAAITQFGISLVLLRRFPDIHRMTMVALAGVGMALIAVVPATLTGHDMTAWLAVVLMGAIFGPLSRVLIAEAPKYLNAAEVGLFVPVETVAASLWAWLFFSEVPPGTTVVGGIVVVLGVLWGTWQPRAT
jgi:drug/metabolite transporter (DMT)-like permease